MLRILLSAVASAIVLTACAMHEAPTPSAVPDRGATLFAKHCAACHGEAGDADTAVASMLLPRPNAFREGLFKLVSTTNGMPTINDLVTTLRRGMPGSTMMSYSWLPDADLRALAGEVQRLAIRGRTASIMQTASITGEPLTADQAQANAERQLLPDASVVANITTTATSEQLKVGQRLYLRHCSGCHGEHGKGVAASANWPTDGTWLQPRDFTAGYLRGGASHLELAYRVRAGMPAAHMPPVMLAEAETSALVAFVHSLIPAEAANHHVQWRRTLRAPLVTQLPAGDAQSFAGGEVIRLPMVPLRWRSKGIEDVWLRVVHDGNELALQLEWYDETRDDRLNPANVMGDGVAIQFATEGDAPLFAMGSASAPVNVWRWHAFDPKEMAGVVDLMGIAPHSGLDVFSQVQPKPRSESIQFGGVRSVGDVTANGLPLSVQTSWVDGRWRATFRRSLAPRSAREVDLTGSEPVLFAVAIWDGSKDRGPGSKCITTWHQLILER